MFLGEFAHNIDDKGRLTIPARFRDELEGGVVVTRGLDNCLWALSRAEWEILADKISALPITNPVARSFSRLMFGSAVDSIPDRQGRVLLPQNLREYAGIESESIIVGMKNRLEIWSPERWNAQMDRLIGDPEAFAAQMQDLGI
jgi:MraZ protein